MVEAVVSVLFAKLIFIIENDAIFRSDLKEEVRSLETELRWIKQAIRHAIEKRNPSPELEMWLVDLVNVSYDVEDVIDGYLAVGGIWIWRKVKARRFVKQIEQIKMRVEKLSTLRSVYATEEPNVIREAEAADCIADRRRFVRTEEIVGLHTETARVEQWLEHRGPEGHVLSIIGMGGLGKTTLARKVFKSELAVGNFKARVWVSVSQEYQLKAVFISVLKQLIRYDSKFEKMDYEELEKEIYKKLKEEKYLVVLDDLWEKSAWEQISVAFPRNGKGSRFILTSRKKEVSPGAEQDILDLQLLNHEESWQLFCRKMSFGVAVKSDLMEDLGRKIVKECCGLPLAIVVVAGLLRGRRPTQWPNVLKSITWWLFNSTDFTSKCRTILLLSYADLPDSLKSCFLYLGLFPEDYLIAAWKLKLLWIAEGFVQPRGGATMEDVADDYLEELAQRNLILVDTRMYHGGPIRKIRVHDLLRDLAITEARKYGFLDIRPNTEYKSSSETSSSEFRRFALHSLPLQAPLQHDKNVRTILLFAGSLDIFKSILNGNKMIRVLDLMGVKIDQLPSNIGELVFLHYLCLRTTGIKKVPDSLSKLERLQTLDILGTFCHRLPNKIWRLKNLRHLFLGAVCVKLPRASAAVIETFGKNILTLELHAQAGFDKDQGPADFLVHLKYLQVLKVYGSMRISSSKKQRSYAIILCNCFPSTLRELWLTLDDFKEQELDVLANLPELKVLYLEQMSSSQNDLIFPCGGFPQLQLLSLMRLRMKKWLVADDAIPNLLHLSIEDCRKLKELPDRLKTLHVQQIDFKGYLPSMKDRHKENGEDWDKIKHIPLITYHL